MDVDDLIASWGKRWGRKPWQKGYSRLMILRSLPYPEYLQSPEWQATRARKLYSVGNRCQVCNNDGPLEVHHRTYERLGAERDEDLTALCPQCHTLFHTHGALK